MGRQLDTEHVAGADHPRHVGDVRVQALADREVSELGGELVLVAAPECVVVVADVRVEAMHEQTGASAGRRVAGQQRRPLGSGPRGTP